jgi:hypothetical protein
LIVPDFEDIKTIPNYNNYYAVLSSDAVEPWGCPACIVRGPIEIPTQTGNIYTIQNCVFYACTAANSEGVRTANFGTGWVSPWPVAGGVSIQCPLSYNAAYPYAEFNYAPAATIFSANIQPNVVEGSTLTLYNAMPPDYRTFDIIKNLAWMSLVPSYLTIGNVETNWPGATPSIAMIDTGGGPVFLSDPNGYLYKTPLPEEVPNPGWTSPGSIACQSTKEKLVMVLGDQQSSCPIQINTSEMPPSVQGLTLVVCQLCSYMMGNQGMNIGGLSALFNWILIDYSSGKVGLKAKTPVSV